MIELSQNENDCPREPLEMCKIACFKASNMEWKKVDIREDINRKKTFSFGHCPNEGGVYPCPDFWPFFYQVIVLKIAFFYSNFTVIVCFFSHFCHNYHQNYHNYHHNYHCNLHYQHQIFFRSYTRKTSFLA